MVAGDERSKLSEFIKDIDVKIYHRPEVHKIDRAETPSITGTLTSFEVL
ncbi:MAG: hypothetical protein M1158_03415 [Candidatus Marsarchaeota archaeon]|nr:hypothetical protein [Candidatus Marsarchaeota archaeon]